MDSACDFHLESKEKAEMLIIQDSEGIFLNISCFFLRNYFFNEIKTQEVNTQTASYLQAIKKKDKSKRRRSFENRINFQNVVEIKKR